MKRFLAALLVCTLVVCCFAASAEEKAVTQPLMDFSAQGQGIVGDPVPCTFGDFKARLTAKLLEWGVPCKFTEAIYSNGTWVHVMTGEGLWVLVKTAASGDDAIINDIQIAGTKDFAYSVLPTAAFTFLAAADCAQTGAWVMELLAIAETPAGYFTETENHYWFENGFHLTFGANSEYLYATVTYEKPEAVKGGYAVITDETEDIGEFNNGLTLDELTRGLNGYAETFGLGTAEFGAVDKMDDTTYSRVADWGECNVAALSLKEEGPIDAILVFNYSGNTDTAWAVAMSAFLTASGAPQEMALAFSYLSGEGSTWEDLCAMQPYAVYNGVMLQCFIEDGVPVAYICGAEEIGDAGQEGKI